MNNLKKTIFSFVFFFLGIIFFVANHNLLAQNQSLNIKLKNKPAGKSYSEKDKNEDVFLARIYTSEVCVFNYEIPLEEKNNMQHEITSNNARITDAYFHQSVKTSGNMILIIYTSEKSGEVILNIKHKNKIIKQQKFEIVHLLMEDILGFYLAINNSKIPLKNKMQIPMPEAIRISFRGNEDYKKVVFCAWYLDWYSFDVQVKERNIYENIHSYNMDWSKCKLRHGDVIKITNIVINMYKRNGTCPENIPFRPEQTFTFTIK